jgi:hypothetical protein
MVTRNRLSAILLAAALGGVPALSAQRPALDSVPTATEKNELVVLVHGMGRTSLSMLPLEWALEAEGFRVLNWGYSSFCCSITELGDLLEHDLERLSGPAPRRVHFVGHSLGSAIIRSLLTQEVVPWTVGHVVLLAPPNQGSHTADRFAPYLGWLLKPLPELRTERSSTVRRLPPVEGVRIGVIAGRFDAKVRPEETVLAEQGEHMVVPATHAFLMFRGDVQRLVITFLREGRFTAGVPSFRYRARPVQLARKA